MFKIPVIGILISDAITTKDGLSALDPIIELRSVMREHTYTLHCHTTITE